METIDQWKEMAFKSLGSLFDQMASGLNGIVAALFILVLGWILTKVVLWMLGKILKVAKVDSVKRQVDFTMVSGINKPKQKKKASRKRKMERAERSQCMPGPRTA